MLVLNFKTGEKNSVETKVKDAFHIFNEGVDKIVEAFDESRRLIGEIRKQDSETEKGVAALKEETDKETAGIIQSVAAKREEEAELERKCQDQIRIYEEEAGSASEELNGECGIYEEESCRKILQYEADIKEIQAAVSQSEAYKPVCDSQEDIDKKTEDYRQDQPIFKKEKERYVEQNLTPGCRESINSLEEELDYKQKFQKEIIHEQTIQKLKENVWNFHEMRDLTEAETDIDKIKGNINSIKYNRDVLVKRYAEKKAVEGKRDTDKKKSVLTKRYKSGVEIKAALQNAAWWSFCFPRNLISFYSYSSWMDFAFTGMVAVISWLMIINPELLGMIIGLTVAAGFITGIFMGLNRRTSGMGMTVQVIKWIFKLGIMVIPYPALIYMLTRNMIVYLVWIVSCILLYWGYDIYYQLRHMSLSYKRMYQKYLEEGKKFYDQKLSAMESLLAFYETSAGEIGAALKNEIQGMEDTIFEQKVALEKEEKLLRSDFEEHVWEEIVETYKKSLLEQLTYIIKEVKNKEEEICILKEKIVQIRKLSEEEEAQQKQFKKDTGIKLECVKADLEARIKAVQLQFHIDMQTVQQAIASCETQIAEQEHRFEAKAAAYRQQREKEKTGFQEHLTAELSRLMNMLKTDGFKEICGFDYRKAWDVMHGMATNTLCLPANADGYFQGSQEYYLRVLEEKASGVPGEDCCLMPQCLVCGFENCIQEPEICNAIEEALSSNREFVGLHGWKAGDINAYHVKKLPRHGLYRLKLTDTGTRPAMVFYDLGNLESNKEEREKLRDFIMRSLVFGSMRYVGEPDSDYFKCQVLVSGHEIDYKSFERDKELEGHFFVHHERYKEIIDQLYQKGLKIKERLNPYNSLYEKNRDREKKGNRPAKDDRYDRLIITNAVLNDFSKSRIHVLMEMAASGDQYGVYPWLFVDMNRLKSDTLGESDKASAKYCLDLLEQFHGALYELIPDESQYLLEVQDKETMMNTLREIAG